MRLNKFRCGALELANFEGTRDGSRDMSSQTSSSTQLDGYEPLRIRWANPFTSVNQWRPLSFEGLKLNIILVWSFHAAMQMLYNCHNSSQTPSKFLRMHSVEPHGVKDYNNTWFKQISGAFQRGRISNLGSLQDRFTMWISNWVVFKTAHSHGRLRASTSLRKIYFWYQLQPFNVNCLLYERTQEIIVIAMDLFNAINQLTLL